MEIGVVENWWFVENCVCIGWVNFNVRKMINMVLNLDCDWIEKYCEEIGLLDCLVRGKDLRVGDCCKGWRW